VPAEDEEAGASAVSVQAEHPTVGPISEEIAADAVLAPLAQAALAPKISAPIRAEYVQRGAHVKKGQLLLTLEDRDLQGNALDSRGAVASAQAAYTTATQATIPEDVQKAQLDVDQAKANLEVANRTAEERKRLLTQGAIAGRDVDTAIAAAVQAQDTYETAVKHLQSVQNTTRHTNAQSAQGQLTSAHGRLMNAEAQVGYASLRSPINGVVTDRPLFPGETATAGTAVITIMDTSSLIAKLHVAQAVAQKLHVGSKADLTIPGLDEPQSATVSLISPALDPGSTTVEVWLNLPNPDGRFKVGTPVHATLHGTTIANAVQVPANAIVPGEDGGTNVLVVGSDGTAKKRAVKIGIRTPEKVQILSGVTPADTVITEGGYGLDDGTKVKIGGRDEGDNAGKDNGDKD
jgi:multidrug efflux pump subunit AcrA (membrane-fusion protein)